jgi:alkylation response protein AidB-like acyl-CoA dehydrogenase
VSGRGERWTSACREEQRLLQETIRGYAAAECPLARLRPLFEAASGCDPALWKGLAEIGVAGLALPEAYGGSGLQVLDLALAAEVIGEAALPVPFLGHALAGLAIAWGGSDAQRAHCCRASRPATCSRRSRSRSRASAGSPSSGSELARGRVTGRKAFVSDGAAADLLVVGTRGGELALVERGAAGVRGTAVSGVDRTRALCEVTSRRLPPDPLADGARVAARVRDAGLVLLAADAFGAAWQLLRMTAATWARASSSGRRSRSSRP